MSGKKISYFLRWLIFLPCAVFAGLIAYNINWYLVNWNFTFLSRIPFVPINWILPPTYPFYIAYFGAGCAATFTSTLLGSYIAPSHRRYVGLGLLVFNVFFYIYNLVCIFQGRATDAFGDEALIGVTEGLFGFVGGITGMVVAICFVVKIWGWKEKRDEL